MRYLRRTPMSNRSNIAALVLAGAASCGAALPTRAQSAGEFEFAGTQRTRYELLDPQYRAGLSNSDQAIALQTSLTFDWRRDGLQVFGEIMDSRTELNDAGSGANATTTDALEPIQAFVAWKHAASTLRVGRFTQDLGKRRLISRTRFGNTVATFAGADWTWEGDEGRSARVLYWVPLRIRPLDLPSVLDNDAELDHGVRHSSISGIFYEFPRWPADLRLETYLFDYALKPPGEPASAAEHVSAGARFYRAPKAAQWNFEAEAILQRGESGGTVAGLARADLAHRASLLHLEVGYTFDRPSALNVLFQYDRASGDETPTDLRNGRFNTLFGDRRFEFGPTGIYNVVTRSNLESPSVRVTFRPRERWQTMLGYRVLRLDEPRDAWVGSGWRDASGAAGRSLGRHLEGSFTWSAIPNRLALELGFAHLWAGRFPEQSAGAAFRGNPQYYYATLTTTF